MRPRESRMPSARSVSICSLTFSPANASLSMRAMSRTRLYGFANGTPFQRSTITDDPEPMPSDIRPGTASDTAIADIASVSGERVYTLAMAVPSCSRSVHWPASASGVKQSMPSIS